MSKNQIITKALLCTLGIYAVFGFTNALVSNMFQVDNGWAICTMVFLLLFTVLPAARFLIFNNDKLACKIAGTGDTNEDFDRRSYLIKSFRLAFVMLGLLLLLSGRTFFIIERLLQTLSLPNIRLWIKHLMYTGDLNFSRRVLTDMSGLIKLAVIAYLLCGGSYVIRRHIKNGLLEKNDELT
ncbi:MAG: hypothetical protein K9M75_11020 [Phycisphaerae bacterium]|nr:hypothetical protein [Phycisphaerae bacterium]